MQQILFHLPFTDGLFPPDGVPIYGFGLMLFLTFLLVAVIWGPRRVRQIGMSRDTLQDLCILLFICGIAGARILYMIQYRDQFAWNNVIGGDRPILPNLEWRHRLLRIHHRRGSRLSRLLSASLET